MQHWLVKSEPSVYAWESLVKDKTTSWEGVRNFAARLHLRVMKKGDLVIFYHSEGISAAVGLAEVAKEAYDDPTSDEAGKWQAVDLKAVKPLTQAVPLSAIKQNAKLSQMALVRISRLSVQPVTKEEFAEIIRMSEGKS